MQRNFELEVCVQSAEDALSAAAAGATRIELNSALQLDGLTPSLATCQWLTAHCTTPLIAMLRPHNDGFQFTAVEKSIMLADCDLLLSAGVAGVAVGAIDGSGNLDIKFLRDVAELCRGRELVCHRAFDRVVDQRIGLEQLIDCGVRRVLTSGEAQTAELGSARLRELVDWSRGRIEILPGAGVNSTNARHLLEATGCTQLHGTFRRNPAEIGQVRKVIEDYLGGIGQPWNSENG